MNFTLIEWAYMLSAINGVECGSDTLVVNLYAHSDFQTMPRTLGAKLDLLNLEQCDRLYDFLLEFWRLTDIKNTALMGD